MKTKTRIMIALLIFTLTGSTYAGWDEWTEAQQDAFETMVVDLHISTGQKSTTKLARRATHKAVISSTPNTVSVPRDPFAVLMEKRIILMRDQHGWALDVTPLQMHLDCKAWVEVSTNQAQRTDRLHDCGMFWAALGNLGGQLNGSGDDNQEQNSPPTVVYADSEVEALGVGISNDDVTGMDVEKAFRSHRASS
tara:strand:+ start:4283 stop:4864 length:582 start_codon:yes stop_codon:yes gene_type:complete